MNKERYRIIPMRADDIEACESIVAVSDPWKRLKEGIDFRTVLAESAKTGMQAFVCGKKDGIAGFILFTPLPVFARGGYLRAIGVAPEDRGHGVGRVLLTFAEERTSRHALHFFLCASSFNKKAQIFYKKCGYRKVGALRDFVMPGASEYIYWKRLEDGSGTRRRQSCRSRISKK